VQSRLVASGTPGGGGLLVGPRVGGCERIFFGRKMIEGGRWLTRRMDTLAQFAGQLRQVLQS
jgi:hypothetical protein